MRVAVLGCGPSGLFAAHGALMAGADDVRIISRKRKSDLHGCQYLHAPIPGLTIGDPREVVYRLLGDAESYRSKVYGDAWLGSVSPEDMEEDHKAWDLRATYDAAWKMYHDYVIDELLTPRFIDDHIVGEFDVVISSMPATALCHENHTFRSMEINASGQTAQRDLPYFSGDDVVTCNGQAEPSWYRLSRVFDYSTVEWPADITPPISFARVQKPLDNNCDCFRNDIIRVGRYGAWHKGILTHHAYESARDVVTELL